LFEYWALKLVEMANVTIPQSYGSKNSGGANVSPRLKLLLTGESMVKKKKLKRQIFLGLNLELNSFVQ
jgi:hypothetical protein